jgi:hypothetical protein
VAGLGALAQRTATNLCAGSSSSVARRGPGRHAGAWRPLIAIAACDRSHRGFDVFHRRSGQLCGRGICRIGLSNRRRDHRFRLSGWFLYPLGFILLCLAAIMAPSLPPMTTQGVMGRSPPAFGFLFVAIAVPSLFATIVKRMIGRARPYVGAHDDPFAYMPFIWRPEYASMPSGHATTAAAAAIAFGAIWPRFARR